MPVVCIVFVGVVVVYVDVVVAIPAYSNALYVGGCVVVI